MTKEQIGRVLKNLRNDTNLSTAEVIKSLHTYGIDISEKTLYSYEIGNSSPKISVFFRLCEIYGVKDVSSTFGFKRKNNCFELSDKEKEIVLAYRKASEDDKAVVDTALKKYKDPSENTVEKAI